MGTWHTSINGNDTFLDIYRAFYERYNIGESPLVISQAILGEYHEEFEDIDTRNNALFGLALAQWETKSLNASLLDQIAEIIEFGKDLDVWEALGADTKMLEKRKKVLAKFLLQINTPRDKPKKRTKSKLEFEKLVLVREVAPDQRKTFEIAEEIVNKNYIHTGGLLMWESGGGSVLYFNGQRRDIQAKWLDKSTLEVTHGKHIDFIKKDDTVFFCGDNVKVIYKIE